MGAVELTAPPSTVQIYRRVANAALPGPAGRRLDVLPAHPVVLRDVPVDRDHLARYDRVCGFPLTDALPPTYPQVLAFPLAMWLLTDPRFPLPAAGTVHVGNRIEVGRPIDAGERLDLSVHAVDLRPHPRGRQFDVVTTATAAGQQVWRGVSTYLRSSGTPAGSGTARDRPAPPVASAVWRVTPQVGRRYAAVSGDHNPIHTSTLGARLFGFRRPIAHGMWSKARCLAALAARLPSAYTVEVAFTSPVSLPGTVAFSATQSPASPGPGWTVALHDARSGRRHLTGTIR